MSWFYTILLWIVNLYDDTLYIPHQSEDYIVKENESGGWIWWDVHGSEIRNILSTDYPSESITADYCLHTTVYHIIRTPYMSRCWWGAGTPKAQIERIKSEIYVYLYSWITVHHPTRAADGTRKEEPGYGWQMCYAAGTQVQVGIMSKGRPCGLNSLICCHHTYDESILGSVPLRLPPSRTNWIPNPAIWRPGQQREAVGSDLLKMDHWWAGLTLAYVGILILIYIIYNYR